MTAINDMLDRHPRPIIYVLGFVVLFFGASCVLHDLIPICHYLFGCDHQLHTAA